MTILNLTVTAESEGGLETRAKADRHQLVMDERDPVHCAIFLSVRIKKPLIANDTYKYKVFQLEE